MTAAAPTRRTRLVDPMADQQLVALRQHLEQVAYHHANVSAYQEPQLEFEA